MILHTASEIISLAKKLETESAGLYRDLALKYPEGKDLFLAFAKENDSNIVQIERAYYGVISDAIEGGFAFDIESELFTFETALPPVINHANVLSDFSVIEARIIRFYSEAARQSDTLMADIPRVFRLVVKKRESRISKLIQLV